MIVTVTDLGDGVTAEATGFQVTVVEGSVISGGGGAVDSVNGLTGVVVLDATDVGADATGAAAAAVAAHVAAADPHPGYDALGDAAAAQAAAEATAAGALSTHAADTTAVHGIADTAALVLTSDSRLSDSRTPTAHASSHAAAGSDPVTLAQSQVTGLTTDLAAKVPTSRTVTAGTGLTGGGDLSADRTLAIDTTAEAERIDDRVGALVADGSGIDAVYDDAGNLLTIQRGAVTITAQTGTSYTLVLGDAPKFVTMTNAAASTLTVPPNSSVAFPVGTLIEGAQLGAGQVTLTPGAGVTINGTPGLKVAAQYGTFGLLKVATDTWLAFGRLSA